MNETIASIIEPYTTESIMRACGVRRYIVYAWRQGVVPRAQYLSLLGELTHRTPQQMLRAVEATSAAKIAASAPAKNKKPTKKLTKLSVKPSRKEEKEKVPA